MAAAIVVADVPFRRNRHVAAPASRDRRRPYRRRGHRWIQPVSRGPRCGLRGNPCSPGFRLPGTRPSRARPGKFGPLRRGFVSRGVRRGPSNWPREAIQQRSKMLGAILEPSFRSSSFKGADEPLVPGGKTETERPHATRWQTTAIAQPYALVRRFICLNECQAIVANAPALCNGQDGGCLTVSKIFPIPEIR